MLPSRLARPASRLALLLAVAVLALPAGTVFAQSSPFGDLPAGTPETTQTQSSNSSDNGGLSKTEAIFVALGGVVVLTGIGILIARDARRRAPVTAGDSEAAHLAADAHKRGRATKQRQRAKAKAARRQRRQNR